MKIKLIMLFVLSTISIYMIKDHKDEIRNAELEKEQEKEEKMAQKQREIDEFYEEIRENIRIAEIEEHKLQAKVSRGHSRGTFVATAYDNTVESQGKWVDQTATGFNLKGHTLESARCIAVDPRYIALNSKVYIEFEEPYEHLNGEYIAYDTGGNIKGRRIDVFFGDGVDKQKVLDFGRRKVKITILDDN